ncbi:hypothetical protein MIND_00468200 [Mycena indigotica]|uniref:Pheromone-regulated membrane protein 10 n=1 Tax=Mycena indigotica TaxID=2126181 RepID=A0A8H6SX61_9AGAR|nr:uncharacterized protein MIND_00468200 [Mycena indigotica]KAF7306765.1 hypothetical protein MIND_00468200 [Mycena indigotica]
MEQPPPQPQNNPFPQSDSTATHQSENQTGLQASSRSSTRPARPSIVSSLLNFGLDTSAIPLISNKTRRRSFIVHNVADIDDRRRFILKLAKALMTFGAPSHRIESQLVAASKILEAEAMFVHLPNIIIVTIRHGQTTRTYFVRAKGRISLSRLNAVHRIYRRVLHDKFHAKEGTIALKKLLAAPPVYNLWIRCLFSFTCASILCVLSFGGSFLDMWISGCCAAVLQYLGLNAASKSSMYANVYEISATIIVAFVARGLSNIPGNYFCYSAISSAGVIVILPGFTVLVSSLELMSKNMFCGSVRIVYAVIYTLFLGFGLTLGSDLYLAVDGRARRAYHSGPATDPTTYTHGIFQVGNGSHTGTSISGVLGLTGRSFENEHIIKGCFRHPVWPWTRQPFPWWTMLFLVPLYTTSSSLSNLQSVSSWDSRKQLAIMVFFSCCSYTANRAVSQILPSRPDIVSATGAFIIGLLGNLYSRLLRGTAFTSMVTGVLFLVPSGIAQGGGLTQTYKSSVDQYSSGFSLALRMISVAAGVSVGLFVGQAVVYSFGSRKNAAHFAF